MLSHAKTINFSPFTLLSNKVRHVFITVMNRKKYYARLGGGKILTTQSIKNCQGVPGHYEDPVWKKRIFSSISVGDVLLVRIISVIIVL